MGAVTNETLSFIYMAAHNPISALEYAAVLEYVFNPIWGAEVFYNYPPTYSGDERDRLSVVGTNYLFVCSERYAARSFLKYSKSPLYQYHFDHIPSVDFWGPNFTECVDSVCHATDVVFLFDTGRYFNKTLTPAENTMCFFMIDAWSNFAKTANPNTPKTLPMKWPMFDSSEQIVRFDTPSTLEQKWNEKDCDLFDYIGYHHGWK